MECIGGELVRELWGGRYVEWVVLPALGSSGGVLICWDSRVVVKEGEEVGGYSLSCLFRCIEDDFQWVFIGVYGPVRGVDRSAFWEELQSIAFWRGAPWCVGGDFNVVHSPKEKVGAR